MKNRRMGIKHPKLRGEWVELQFMLRAVELGLHSCTVRGSDGPYQGDPFEYLAAYVFQERSWYIIPAELVVGQGSIALYPKLKGAKYGPYKEAWHLLRKGLPAATHWVDLIQGCVEEDGGRGGNGSGWRCLRCGTECRVERSRDVEAGVRFGGMKRLWLGLHCLMGAGVGRWCWRMPLTYLVDIGFGLD